jgi:chromosome segregation ATPase
MGQSPGVNDALFECAQLLLRQLADANIQLSYAKQECVAMHERSLMCMQTFLQPTGTGVEQSSKCADSNYPNQIDAAQQCDESTDGADNTEEINNLNKKCTKLEQEKAEVNRKCTELEQEKEVVNKKCTELEQEKAEVNRKCVELELEKKELNKKCDELEQKHAEMIVLVGEMSDENANRYHANFPQCPAPNNDLTADKIVGGWTNIPSKTKIGCNK